jgi:Mesyanzhinovviridae DNA polymerase I
MVNAPVAVIDFETKSACSLKKCGAWRYSIDETTRILCLAWRLPPWVPGRTALWVPHQPSIGLDEIFPAGEISGLIDWIEGGGLISAHNSSFERCIWTNILSPQYGWPMIPIEAWRCSASKAAAHSLPRSLEDAGAALSLAVRKDLEGHKLMMKLSRPRKSRKAERELWEKSKTQPPSLLWHESIELFEKLWSYCRQDVLAEAALSDSLPDLNPHETKIYTMDQTINARGFQLDLEAVTTALALIALETKRLNTELSLLTGGKVKAATCRAQMMAWLSEEGLQISDTQKETIDAELLLTQSKPVRRALEILQALGRSSTSKYQAMQQWAAPDGRVRGSLLYHAASTGRWGGSGPQPQNFKRGSVKDMDELWEKLKNGWKFGNVMEALSNALRGAIIASEGKKLFVGDYAAIEARVVLWLAGDDESLDIFRQGKDMYKEMATAIYNVPLDTVTTEQRFLAKTAVLGLSYGMGASKFQATLEKSGVLVDEEFAKHVVDTYRARFHMVKQLWYDQEDASIRAVKLRKPVICGRITWLREGIFLYCQLPSGRRIAYPFPQVKSRTTPWGEAKPSLTFMGTDPYTHKWRRQHTFGASIVENEVQSISRDYLAESLLLVEASKGFEVALHIHDEVVAEGAPEASLDQFTRLLSTCPKWMKGCPLSVESWKGPRYKKG